METASTTPVLQRPTVLVPNQAEPKAPAIESKYASLDDGVFETVKDLHVQLETLLKTIPLDESKIETTLESIVAQNCPLPAKFLRIDVSDLLKKNKNIKGEESLAILVSALGLLEKYGRNLLRPKRPALWKCINFANSVFRTRVDIIKGARHLLQLMGYSEVVEDGLSFPADSESADPVVVAIVTADLAIAKTEINMYYLKQHPYPYRIKDCLDGTMTMIQIPGDSPSGTPKSFFVRRPEEGRATIYENVPNTSQPFPTRLPPNDIQLKQSSAPVVASKPQHYAVSDNIFNNEGIISKIGNLAPSQGDKIPASVGLGYFAQNPECVVTVQESMQENNPQPAKQTSSVVHVRVQADQTKATDLGQTECVMCGKMRANMQCPICSGLRCESCDKQWHIHPSRRSHQRRELEASPVFPPMIYCNVCGTEQATVLCNNCSSSFCDQHDVLFHNHPLRVNHVRQPLRIESQSPTVESPPKNIVLSPVDTLSPLQDSARTPESRSGSIKRRPVPTPRSSVSRSNNSNISQPILSPGGVSKFDNSVFIGQVKTAEADPKVPAKEFTRTKSDTSPVKTNSEPSPTPDPFLSLPANTNNKTALLENVVKKDIAVLQKIRGLRAAIATEGLAADSSLKAEERHLLAEHTLLLKKQKDLEESMMGLDLGSSTEEVEVVAIKESHFKNSPRSVAQDIVTTTPVEAVAAVVNLDEVSRQTDQKTQAVPSPRRRSTSPPVPQKPNIASKSQHSPQRRSSSGGMPIEAQLGTVTTPSVGIYVPPQVSPRPQLSAINTSPVVVQPGRVQQLATNLRLNSPAVPVPGAGNNNSVRVQTWLCSQCGDYNTSPECRHCKTHMQQSSNTRPSVAELGQQIGKYIPIPTPQTGAKPAVTLRHDVQPPQESAAGQSGDNSTAATAAATASGQAPMQNVFLLQQLDEIAIEKQRAKEDDERNQAREREEVVKKQTGPLITPRSNNLRSPFGSVPPAGLTKQPQPILNQAAAAAGLAHVMRTEDRRRLDEQRAQSLSFIKLLQNAEDCGFLPEDVMVATESINKDGGQQGQEVKWLQSNFEDYIYTVVAMSTNHLKTEVGQSVGEVTCQEATAALRKHYGNVEKAVEECVAAVQRRVLSLVDLGFDHQHVYESLAGVEGKMDDALTKLHKGMAKEFSDRIWLQEDKVAQEREILNLGQEERQVIVNRRLRLLLADYELPSWGRAETAARLIDTRKYTTEDAIVAARECGDFQRATQYLEKTCSICYSEFPMNKLNTLINCQCTICLECLQNHFTVVVRDRNILNATCPACDLPDLREGETDAMSDYFGFLDMLLKGFLDKATYCLFQNKLLYWNLIKQDNFRWCSHCGNGFINEAPNRRKMRCPECNQLTCFQCKKPWMEQHENITCDDFQAWKEANDPNAQLQGLAIHLKENGIDCPNCKMRYELAKGGCMHFKCGMCTHEFCSGCNAPFKKDCRKFPSCHGKGLHAHHPRDCLFYLRDLDMATLKKHLKKHNIDYKRNYPANQEAVCAVMEQKEGPEGLADANCGRDTVRSGLCEIHYKEYLVSKMNQNRIDPADLFNIESLRIVLQRNNLPVPARADNEPEAAYKERMLQEVKRNLPLEEKNPRDRSQSTPKESGGNTQ